MPIAIGSPRSLLRAAALLLFVSSVANTAALAQNADAGRLSSGAIRPGDRIVLWVADEPSLTDTFTVAAGPAITLPLVGLVSLAGVNRGELQAHLVTVLGKVIRQPVVNVRTLIRLAVLGEVARPGFFAVPADALLSDAITLAGGPTGNAEMRRLSLSRHGLVLQSDETLRRSIADGLTIDDLGIAAGDELMIPRRHDGERTARIIGLVIGIPVGILLFTRM